MTLVPKNLTCPNKACKHEFTQPTIKDGKVSCPNCNRLIFRFLPEGEQYNPETFMESIHGQIGKDAAYSAREFLPKIKPPLRQVIAAGMLVNFIWQNIDQAFKVAEQKHD